MRTHFFALAGVAAGLTAPDLAPAGPGAMFERFDADGDGAITYAGIQAWRSRFFAAADADENRFLTSEGNQQMRRRRQASAADNGAARSGPRRGGRVAVPVARHGADGDGRVSEAEFVDAPFAAPQRFDRNNDERLTRDESAGRCGG